MDRIANYRQIISGYLLKQAEIPYAPGSGMRHVAVIDQERDHYLILTVGQSKSGPVNDTDIYLSIQDNKVLLLKANIDWDVLAELEEAGIAKEDLIDATQSLKLVN